MYRIDQIRLSIDHSEDDLRKKILKKVTFGTDLINWSSLKILHKSIDSRDKNNIFYVYNLAFDFVDNITEEEKRKILKNQNVREYKEIIFNDVLNIDEISIDKTIRPIIVGFGPAGIFASLIFVKNGLKPIIIERGKSLDDRIKDVDRFFTTLELNEESNVCFGEGGAGAFSDGKLNTNNKDRTGVYKYILETFVRYGADKKILYENNPDIGTDKLVDVIKNIREDIVRLGAEIHYNEKWIYKKYEHFVESGNPVILAIGNSSRDTFRDLIDNGFKLKPKPFAIGYRISHRQSLINEIQYGKDNIEHFKNLDKATYKLVYNLDEKHSIYSFCMCPGGYVINSSNFKNMLSINGMSYNDRSGKYANSAIVITISKDDIKDFEKVKEEYSDSSKYDLEQFEALKLIEFQESIERKAYNLEEGYIPYKVIGNNEINESGIFKGLARHSEKLLSIYDSSNFKIDINAAIKKGLTYFNKIMPGFYENYGDNAESIVIAGVETRTSSPVKLDRDDKYMCNIEGFYPCGEGLGHGGGIMSSAADGVNVAMSILKGQVCEL